MSLDDVQKGPPMLTVDEINVIVDKASENLRPSTESTIEQIAELRKQIEALEVQVRPELGTMSELQQSLLPWVTWDTTPEGVPPDVGTLAWDGGTTLGVQMTTNVVGRVNESGYYYIKASSAITKGQVIMFTGAVGASGVPTGAPATGVTDGSYIMGIAAENIANNGFGLVQFLGTLRGVNLSAYSDGDILWYNPAVTGGLTKTKPNAPNIKVQMAAVISASNNGTMLIRVTAGSELGGTDSNVQFGALANGQTIIYDNASGYWKNSTLTAGSGITITNGAGSITIDAAVAALAAGANISITGTTTKTIAVTGLGTMAFQNTGVSGSFTTADVPPKTVTVSNGIITSIV